MLLIQILLLTFIFIFVNNTKWTLYNTNQIDGKTYHDCLYLYWSESTEEIIAPRELISYCIRPYDTKESVSFEEKLNKSLSNIHEKYTFIELRERNLTTNDLYNWQAPIDIIEEYDIYLEYHDQNLSTKYFYRCKSLWFGPYCQYTFDSNAIFAEIVFKRLKMKKDREIYIDHAILITGNGTCYTHLKCNYTMPSFCLDWREICDGKKTKKSRIKAGVIFYNLGKIDCLEGEDEENCFELEINECDLTREFRCRNGLCIPNEFIDDEHIDCLDGSDEDDRVYQDECEDHSLIPSIICEERFCGFNTFSCGDSNCLNYFPIEDDRELESCLNGRDLKFKKKQFIRQRGKYERVCWESIVDYLIGFNEEFYEYGYYDKETYDTIASDICPPIVLFPSAPIIDGHIQFLYFWNKTDWSTNKSPNLICFNKNWCPSFEISFIFDNFTCIHYDKLPLNDIYDEWNIMINDIKNLFKECSHSDMQIKDEKCLHSSLIQCGKTSKCLSKYRFADGYNDCPNSLDELSNKSCLLHLTHRFKCLSEDKCIPLIMVENGKPDCLDKSDESIRRKTCLTPGKNLCHIEKLKEKISFRQICNGIVDISQTFSNISNETDETNCEQWSCQTFYTNCNNVWNCKDGRDELNCIDIHPCPQGKLYCFDQNLTYHCISSNDNDTSYCIASAKDREYCRKKYPNNPDLRYRCLDDSKCISPLQLCDCQIDCPLKKDDENLLCMSNQCKTNEYRCKTNSRVAKRCDFKVECRSKEDELLCDLMDISSKELHFGLFDEDFDQYPFTTKNNSRIFNRNDIELYHSEPLEVKQSVSKLQLAWYCNRGLLIRTTYSYYCLCSPAYYGDHCQFESNRLSVVLQLRSPSMISRNQLFKFFIFLLNVNESIIAYEQIIYSDINSCLAKYFIYLLYPIESKLKTNYSVRIDNFIITKEEGIRYSQSWYFDIKFHFLPVNRITAILTLSLNTVPTVRCGQLTCIHGRCIEYSNTRRIFCHCYDGWSGISCNIPVNCQCSKKSLCISNELCVCPIGRIGPQCRVPYNPCQLNSCKNNGTCVPVDERATNSDGDETQQQFVCLCSEEFAGRYCEKTTAKIHIQFRDKSWSSILIHLIKTSKDFSAEPRRRSIFKRIGLNNNITIYTSFLDPPQYLPNLIYIQAFDNNIINEYHLLGILPLQPVREITTSVLPSTRCPHIRELFNPTILRYHSLRRIKFYQNICAEKRVFCFYDDDQMCLCNKFDHVDCFDFNHSLVICKQSTCENNGLCIQDEEICHSKSICICQECFYGTRCQFTIQSYVLSLDGIIGQHILRGIPLLKQPFLIQISAVIVSVMFIIGIVLNIFSILTFKKPKVGDVGCRIYLFSSSIISLLMMFIFLSKFIYLLSTQIILYADQTSAYISCILIEYLIRILPSISDWLNACVAIERTVTIIFNNKFNSSKSIKCAKFVIIIVVFVNIVSSIHDPINRRLVIDDDEDQRAWCSISFEHKSWLNSYNSSMNLIHFIIPFAINIISAFIIIIRTAYIRSMVRKKNSYRKHLKKQFNEFKHLIISPCILILLALPRLIISFVYACMKADRTPYLFLFGYFISYIPTLAIFLIFVLPSRTYKKDFYDAIKLLF